MAIISTFGVRLRSLREARGLSTYALALASGIDATLLGRFERGDRGNPSLATLEALASALGCTLDALAGREENPEKIRS